MKKVAMLKLRFLVGRVENDIFNFTGCADYHYADLQINTRIAMFYYRAMFTTLEMILDKYAQWMKQE